MSEIWIYEHEIQDFKIDGYNFYANSNEKYSAGGVGVFVRNIHDCNFFRYQLTSADILKLSLRISGKVFTLICVYRLHSVSIHQFLEEFSVLLGNEKSTNVLILGDFNLDILKQSVAADNYQILMANNGFTSYLNESTRRASGTCLDHIFVGWVSVLKLHYAA